MQTKAEAIAPARAYCFEDQSGPSHGSQAPHDGGFISPAFTCSSMSLVELQPIANPVRTKAINNVSSIFTMMSLLTRPNGLPRVEGIDLQQKPTVAD